MDQVNIIRDLLSWLEKNLDQPLSLDNVAAKAGYSKWHLQRMFKEVTGQAIGAYIRARRLSKAAIALRTTSRPILDIALQYRFDSQQTLTRAFKKQFAKTPAHYRRTPEWYAYGIRPPIRLDAFTLPENEFVHLDNIELLGITQTYACKLEDIGKTTCEMRSQFWQAFTQHVQQLPPFAYGLYRSQPNEEREDEQDVFYTTAFRRDQVPPELPGRSALTTILIEAGDYVKFRYTGAPDGLSDFIPLIYSTCMPTLNLTRRAGMDIELFHLAHEPYMQRMPQHIVCDYFVPILR